MKVWNDYFRVPEVLSISLNEVIKIFDELNLKKGNRILDCGCGYGKLSRILTDKGFDVHAVDNSQSILDNIKDAKFKISCQDAKNLKFDDNYFDLVFTDGLLEHLNRADIDKVIQEEIRVSKRYVLNLIPSDTFVNKINEFIFSRGRKEYRNREWMKIHLNNISINYKIESIRLRRLIAIIIDKTVSK
jgi:ubiquinone/menaquinone biosynthesis C-methylase UbiE